MKLELVNWLQERLCVTPFGSWMDLRFDDGWRKEKASQEKSIFATTSPLSDMSERVSSLPGGWTYTLSLSYSLLIGDEHYAVLVLDIVFVV